MSSMLPDQEDYSISCKTLIDLVASEEDKSRKKFLLKDFLTKSRYLSAEEASIMSNGFLSNHAIPDESKSLNQYIKRSGTKENTSRSKHSLPAITQKESIQLKIGIVTVIQEELTAAKVALGIDQTENETRIVKGRRYWEKTITNNQGKNIKIILTMVGEPRNLPCANASIRLFHAYDYKIDLCILIGIAGGMLEKVNLGDVVVSKLVMDYEGARLEPDGTKKRPVAYTLEKNIKLDLNYFEPNICKWHDHFTDSIEKLKKIKAVPKEIDGFYPKYHKAIILSGEKLIGDGSLPDLRIEYSEEVRAAEMEGSGFASTCDEFEVPWLVFRGISDYGDPNKPHVKNWQTPAALSAATAAIAFIRYEYREEDPSF